MGNKARKDRKRNGEQFTKPAKIKTHEYTPRTEMQKQRRHAKVAWEKMMNSIASSLTDDV
jgi:hypothetical protein